MNSKNYVHYALFAVLLAGCTQSDFERSSKPHTEETDQLGVPVEEYKVFALNRCGMAFPDQPTDKRAACHPGQ